MEILKSRASYEIKEGMMLYKYMPVEDYRLKTLEEKSVWFSYYDHLNDPYEMNANKSNENTETNPDAACREYNMLQNKQYIAIFSLSKTGQILPLWGNYANNHKGICVEYEVVEPECIFPVIYQKERTMDAYVYSGPTAFINSDEEGVAEMGRQLSIKAKDWRYERECRCIEYNPNRQEGAEGEAMPCEKVGLRLNSIIIGLNCEEEDVHKVKQLAAKLNVPCKRARLSNKKFKIKFK